ncbi:MAG TPA: antitoxin family protein [Pyrinomonadaceae bacterium]|nr:antitoxin family protein [Pyrinomonadaceae bacterium]
MIENIQAIYKNGVLHPLKPLDLPEDKIVEIDVRDISERDSDKEKWLEEFDLWINSLDSNTPNLTDEQISRESIYEEQLNRQR